LSLARTPFGARFRFGLPASLEFFGDEAARAAFEDALQRLQDLGGEAVPIDFSVFSACAEMLYGSALVAQRYEAIRGFFDTHEAEVMEPVRSIIGAGRQHTAADLVAAQIRLAALAQQAEPLWRGIDVMVVPTAPTHPTIAAMRADPVALNRQLGAYTNFVNLLDYAALSVPSSFRPDGLPFGITLIGLRRRLGQRFHRATNSAGRHRRALPAPAPSPVRPPTVSGRGGRAPLGHAAQQPAHRAWRAPARGHRDRARLPLLCPGRHRAAQTRPAACSGRRGGAHQARTLGNARRALRLFRCPRARAIGYRHAELTDGGMQGFPLRAQALGAPDITHFGGWRAYLASLQVAQAPHTHPFP
jgi:allophanate hydrolase